MSDIKYQRIVDPDGRAPVEQPTSRRWALWALAGLLACSLGLNVIGAVQLHGLKRHGNATPFAGLTYSEVIPWSRENSWYNGNQSLEDLAWATSPGFAGEVGVVALSSAWAKSLGLPPAQHWPWDKSKGVYVIEAAHIIHCLKDVRAVVQDAYADRPASRPFEHVHHCIDSLRQFVMCHADDTPRYKGKLYPEITQENPHGGFGQGRVCRDWGKLVDWMVETHACYRRPLPGTPVLHEEDNYKFCPDGRVLWEEEQQAESKR